MTEIQQANIDRLEALISHCFEIEKLLPMFDAFSMETASNEQSLRREIYRTRVDLGRTLNYYQMDCKNGK